MLANWQWTIVRVALQYYITHITTSSKVDGQLELSRETLDAVTKIENQLK